MIESPQEDYQSFQSNLAIGPSRHAASLGMINTIRTVPTTVLIDGHEAMYKDSFEATQSLTNSVLASELKVGQALEEIERLKEQVERVKLEANKRKREREQKGSKGRDHRQHPNQQYQPHQQSQKQQQQHRQPPSRQVSLSQTHVASTSPSPAIPPRPDFYSYGSSNSVGSPPDLLY
ncbi:hypothetical protein EC968_006048 [Mortierella alpina]|nr:hypothetical protein EC968_006048 [Mortierella alpina]